MCLDADADFCDQRRPYVVQPTFEIENTFCLPYMARQDDMTPRLYPSQRTWDLTIIIACVWRAGFDDIRHGELVTEVCMLFLT